MTDAQSKQRQASQGVGLVPTMIADQDLNTEPIQWEVLSDEEARKILAGFSEPKLPLDGEISQ